MSVHFRTATTNQNRHIFGALRQEKPVWWVEDGMRKPQQQQLCIGKQPICPRDKLCAALTHSGTEWSTLIATHHALHWQHKQRLRLLQCGHKASHLFEGGSNLQNPQDCTPSVTVSCAINKTPQKQRTDATRCRLLHRAAHTGGCMQS